MTEFNTGFEVFRSNKSTLKFSGSNFIRPVTLLSVLVFQGERGSIVNGIAGEWGGIVEIREMGGSGISFLENYP